MLFGTGDTHGVRDIHKLSEDAFPERRRMTREDYVLVAGDFGYPRIAADGARLREWWEACPFTVLFVDGNHEDFDALEAMPTEPGFGGTVRRVAENVYHLPRGQVLEIAGKSVFVFGGAFSDDVMSRVPGEDWWDRELPSDSEMAAGVASLERAGMSVDLVVTHAAPAMLSAELGPRRDNAGIGLARYLDWVAREAVFGQWLFGHYHEDRTFRDPRFRELYQDVVRLA